MAPYSGSHIDKVAKAKELCVSLLQAVKENYDSFKERGPSRDHGRDHGRDGHGRGHGHRQDSYGGGHGGGHGGGYGGGYGGNQGQGYSNNNNNNGMAPSPTNSQSPASAAANSDLMAQWTAYYAQQGVDPYAAYGGYENYVQYYQQYYYNQAGGEQAPGAAPGQPSDQPPPPPPGDSGPPPPPPPAGGNGPASYSQVSTNRNRLLSISVAPADKLAGSSTTRHVGHTELAVDMSHQRLSFSSQASSIYSVPLDNLKLL